MAAALPQEDRIKLNGASLISRYSPDVQGLVGIFSFCCFLSTFLLNQEAVLWCELPQVRVKVSNHAES